MAISIGQIVQVTNVTPSASIDQMRSLFGCLGTIEDIVLYPSEETLDSFSKVCYIRFHDITTAGVALHLNNTVFLDRALVVLPLPSHVDKFPEDIYSDLVRAPANTSAGVLPRSAEWPLDVISMVVGKAGEQVIQTLEPRLATLGLAGYPPLPTTTDGNRIEEIRRTVVITNLDPTTTPEDVIEFFNPKSEVRCVRMADYDTDKKAAFIEFTEQAGVIVAFTITDTPFKGRSFSVQHSSVAIIKPANNFSTSLDEANKRLKEAERAQPRHRSRSRSSRHSHHRHRSRSPSSRHSRTRGSDSHGSHRRSGRSKSPPVRGSARGRPRSRSRNQKRSQSRSPRRHGASSTSRRRSRSRPGRRDQSDRKRRDDNNSSRRGHESSSRRRHDSGNVDRPGESPSAARRDSSRKDEEPSALLNTTAASDSGDSARETDVTNQTFDDQAEAMGDLLNGSTENTGVSNEISNGHSCLNGSTEDFGPNSYNNDSDNMDTED